MSGPTGSKVKEASSASCSSKSSRDSRNSLGAELIKAEALRSERERPDNPDAVDLTMRGAALLTSPSANRSEYDEAIKLFERALVLDPQNFQAMTNLAAALAVRVENNWGPPAVDMARAEALLNAAAALRPDDSYLHLTKGYAYSLRREWRSALSEAEAAVANDRSNADAYAATALYKMHLGRSNDGLADIDTALRLSPHDWEAPVWQTRLCHFARASRAVGAGDRTVREGGRGDWLRSTLREVRQRLYSMPDRGQSRR